MVGAVLSLDREGDEGHVERVAVDRGYRRRGIAEALLRQAFADFARAGKQSCTLFTHSATGALALYEKAGMTVTMSSTHLRRPL
jgi:ribosomal protein S18 acetylase RimI-like enzyme